jgi:hypothetical protein
MVTARQDANSFAIRFGLPILSWGVAFHVAAIAMLFGFLGLSSSQTRVIAAWKESFVVLLFVTVAVRALSGRGIRSPVSWTDMWVAGLMGLALSFVIAGRAVFQFNTTAEAELLGFRDLAFFLLLYWVGRSTPSILSDPRTLRRLYAVALVTAAIGVVEWFFVTPEQLALLGIAAYYHDFLGLSAFAIDTPSGLPGNYWTEIGGTQVQRAGSVFVSGQGMAVPFILLLPAATGALLVRGRPSLKMMIGYGVIWLGMLLTITRMSILACFVAVLAFVLLLKRPVWAASALSFAIAGLVVGLLLIPGLATFAWETVMWQSTSSGSHVADYQRGLLAFLQRPFGYGLGTTDLAAMRAGLEPLMGDNLYLKYGLEMGVMGLLLHVLIYAGIVLAGMRVLRTSGDRTTRIGAIVVIVSTFAILLNAMTAAVFNSFPLAYLYFWLAGSLVSLAHEARAAERPALAVVPALSG